MNVAALVPMLAQATLSGHIACSYYSRRTSDEGIGGTYGLDVFWAALREQAAFRSAIFDGEVVIWNKRHCALLPFSFVVPCMHAAHMGRARGNAISKRFTPHATQDDDKDDKDDKGATPRALLDSDCASFTHVLLRAPFRLMKL